MTITSYGLSVVTDSRPSRKITYFGWLVFTMLEALMTGEAVLLILAALVAIAVIITAIRIAVKIAIRVAIVGVVVLAGLYAVGFIG